MNPGNSGGPLFDGAGNVVGINAQIYSRSGGFHVRLGVTVQDLTQPLAGSPKRVALLVWRAGEQLFVPVAPV